MLTKIIATARAIFTFLAPSFQGFQTLVKALGEIWKKEDKDTVE